MLVPIPGGVARLGDARDTYETALTLFGPDHLLIYDPPWELAGSFDFTRSRHVLAFADGKRAADVIRVYGAPTWIFVWDCVTSWYTPNRPLKRHKLALWYGPVGEYRQKGYLLPCPPRKPKRVSNTRGSYDYVPDPAGKMLSDVFHQPITQLRKTQGYCHAKPLDWLTALVGNTCDLPVVDPFFGSGASYFAAQTLGRPWLGGELDPGRFSDFTLNQLYAGPAPD